MDGVLKGKLSHEEEWDRLTREDKQEDAKETMLKFLRSKSKRRKGG